MDRQIVEVLGGTGSDDELGEQDQAIVRKEWAERIVSTRADLDYAEKFSAAGESYSELDEDGNLSIRSVGGH